MQAAGFIGIAGGAGPGRLKATQAVRAATTTTHLTPPIRKLPELAPPAIRVFFEREP